MKAVIPLAGKGTRLRPHTYVTPKPLLRVGGKPVMSYLLDQLEPLGVREIVFITGHLKEKVEEYVGREYAQFRSHFVEQPVQNGTAGAVQLAEPYIDDELLIIFVDTLFDADLSLARRLQPGVAGVVWAKEVEDYQRFGVIVRDADGFMQRIVEKPREPISKLANIGLYYIQDWQLFFDGVRHTLQAPPGPAGEFYITDAFQYMIDRGAKLLTASVAGWYDCGQLETLLATNRHLLESGRARRPGGGGKNVRVHEPVRVAENVTLENVEIGPNVTVESGCMISQSMIRDCIIGERVKIEKCELRDSLIGNDVVLEGVVGQVSIADHSEIRR